MQIRGVDQRLAVWQVHSVALQSDPFRSKEVFRAVKDQRVTHHLHPDKQPGPPNHSLQTLADALGSPRLRIVQFERVHLDLEAKPVQTYRKADTNARGKRLQLEPSHDRNGLEPD